MTTEEVLEQLGWTRDDMAIGETILLDAGGLNVIAFVKSDFDLKDVREFLLAEIDRNFQLLTDLDQAAGFVTM